MAISANPVNGLIAVAYASDIIRIYEPIPKPIQNISSTNDNIYIWKELSHWKCELVQYLSWFQSPSSNTMIAASSANGTYV